MHAFVTVGSTHFHSFIASIFTEKILSVLRQKGYTDLVVQCGNSAFELADSIKNGETQTLRRSGVNIQFWKFKPDLEEDIKRADLVIAHAGAGTILDVLRRDKMMVVVPNPTLLDNHQDQLALALEEMGYLRAANVENLVKVIEEFDPSTIKPFPQYDGSRFARIVDEVMGFI